MPIDLATAMPYTVLRIMASTRLMALVPVVEATIMSRPHAGVKTRPIVVTPMGNGWCMATMPATLPLSMASSMPFSKSISQSLVSIHSRSSKPSTFLGPIITTWMLGFWRWARRAALAISSEPCSLPFACRPTRTRGPP